MPARPDPKDRMDHPVMQAHQVLMVTLEIKDHVDPPARPAHLETQETKDQRAIPAESLAPKPVQQVQPARLASPEHQALPADQVMLVKTAVPAPQELPAMQAPQAVQAKLAVQAAPAMQADPAHPAVAITAHRLVWLQVIKHPRWSKRLDNTFHRQIYDSIYFYSLPHCPKFDMTIKTQMQFSFSSQTFHVEIFYFYLIAFFLNMPLFKQLAVLEV